MSEHKTTSVEQVNEDGAFEILCADVLRTEPFPNEIKVVGKATSWAEKIKQAAVNRGWSIEISIKELEDDLHNTNDDLMLTILSIK